MNKQKTLIFRSVQQGALLVEAMIAILIFSVGILAIVGLQAAMIKNTTDSKFRVDASFIAQNYISSLWYRQLPNLASYSVSNAPIPDALPNGTVSTAVSGTQVTVTITWQQPGEAQHNFTTVATIAGE